MDSADHNLRRFTKADKEFTKELYFKGITITVKNEGHSQYRKKEFHWH